MKNILITGARSGIIGDVIERIKLDYNIYLTVHTESELTYVEDKYKKYDNIKCFKLDLLDEEDIYKVDKIDIDILVCNGAIMESGSLIDIPFKNIRDNFEVNFFSNLKLIRRVVRRNKGVRIIIMSSLAGRIPMPFCGVYSASKAALSKMFEAFDMELRIGGKDAKVVIIEPGLYETGFNEYGFDKKYEFMDIDTFFDEQLELIRNGENLFLRLFQKKSLSSISNKIEKAIRLENPRLYYRAPFSQALFVKIYNFFR